MLFSERAGRRYAVSQPVHAALSSQLAAAWGNEQFGEFEPREDVILGALLHDIGWIDWELAPTLNHETGLPHTFMQLPTQLHLAIWGPASRQARPFGRYVSLLASLHGTGLYGFHDYTRDTEQEAAAARAFVHRETDYQQQIIDEMAGDPTTAEQVLPETIARNRRLVAVWDAMSLAICGGLSGERIIQNVPTASDPVQLTMVSEGSDIIVRPWPFSSQGLPLSFEARELDRTFDDEAEMRATLEATPWSTLHVTLRSE